MTTKSARRFRSAKREGDTFVLDDASAHKIRHVLRLNVGDTITVVDADGFEHPCLIATVDGSLVATPVIDTAPLKALPQPWPITIALAVVKNERMDWAVEKISEAGAARLLPFVADRSEIRTVSPARVERWRRLAETASLQSGGSCPTEILAVAGSLDEVLSRNSRVWHFDPRCSLNAGDAIRGASAPDIILVGPEGGWSPRELMILEKQSTAINLGPFTLRTETAALIAVFLSSLMLSNTSKQPPKPQML